MDYNPEGKRFSQATNLGKFEYFQKSKGILKLWLIAPREYGSPYKENRKGGSNIESLSGKPCNDRSAQTVLASWLLFPVFTGYTRVENNLFSIFFKMAGKLAQHITLFASWYCGSPTFQKTSPFFWKLSCIALQTKTSLPGRQARSIADNRFWMVIFWCDPVNMPGSIWRNIGLLKNERIVNQNLPLTNWMKLSGKRTGEIERR